MYRDGRDAELLARAQKAQGDLAAIGYQDLVEHVVLVASSEQWVATSESETRFAIRHWLFALLLNNYQRFAEFDRLAVFDKNLRHGARARRWNLVHRLHRLDDQARLAALYLGTDFDERLGAGLGSPIGGADHRRGHRARVLGDIGDTDQRGGGRGGRRGGDVLGRRSAGGA